MTTKNIHNMFKKMRNQSQENLNNITILNNLLSFDWYPVKPVDIEAVAC